MGKMQTEVAIFISAKVEFKIKIISNSKRIIVSL